jgi:hypothetical protein
MRSGREFDLHAGRALAPTLVFIGYGTVKFFMTGTSLTHWPDTYLAVGGGIASWVAVLLWGAVVWGKPGVLRSLCAFAAFIPMLYSIYAIAYLGLCTIYRSTLVDLSVVGILFGVICILLGYRMAIGLAALTRLQTKPH